MPEFIKYCGVGLSATTVWESYRGRVAHPVERSTVIHCCLTQGSPEPRPIVSGILGAVLLVPGLISLGHAQQYLLSSGSHWYLRYESAMLFMGLIGVWLLVQSSLRRRYFFAIQQSEKRIKLVFTSEANPTGLREFLVDCREKYGFYVDDTLSKNA